MVSLVIVGLKCFGRWDSPHLKGINMKVEGNSFEECKYENWRKLMRKKWRGSHLYFSPLNKDEGKLNIILKRVEGKVWEAGDFIKSRLSSEKKLNPRLAGTERTASNGGAASLINDQPLILFSSNYFQLLLLFLNVLKLLLLSVPHCLGSAS